MHSFIKGTFKRTIFSGDNGYTVGLFKIKECSDNFVDYLQLTVTFTGYFHELNDSDTYMLYGDFVKHAKYGEQFSVEYYERCMPEEKDSIVEFLCSGLFKGIGEKTATKIVDVLGKDTLTIILHNPDNLILISGITKKQIDILHTTLVEYEASYHTILLLNELGFLTRESMIIYNKYKLKINQVLEEDLYQIVEDIKEISFKKVDTIALKKDYLRNDIRRVKAAILYTFEEIGNLLGHSYLTIDEVYHYTIKFLANSISEEEFIESLNVLILENKVIKKEEKYYLKKMWDTEENIVKRLKYLVNREEEEVAHFEEYVMTLENDLDITYNVKQLEAIREALFRHFLVITGGPGTGKTTIVKSVVDLYRDIHKLSYDNLVKEVVLLAPTGRASKRLSEATLFPATTIHSFLKWNKDLDKFAVNEYNKSDAKVVIIDEASMVDVYLFDSLLRGLRLDTKIVMVGDYHQLPSVGPGQLLKDIIESEVIPVVKLEDLYRQKSGSNIITLAYDVNHGEIEENVFEQGDDLKFFHSSDDVTKIIEKICVSYVNCDYKKIQVLVPMYKTLNGIDKLNQILQDVFNPKAKNKNETMIGDVLFREQDKVLQLVNMPEEKIFNGDIGLITKIDKKGITIDFDGNEVTFTSSNYHKFKHGYAISIHKSQGSEFDTVIIPVVQGYSKMLYRKLYYTAITRCKKELFMVGDINALRFACSNDNADIRKTTIREKLINKMSSLHNFEVL